MGESGGGSVAESGPLSAGVRGDIEALGDEEVDSAMTAVSSPSSLTLLPKFSGGTFARARSTERLSEGRSLAGLVE